MHRYSIRVEWTGNAGTGTADYRAYSRGHEISAPGKSLVLPGSSDPVFRGDPAHYNPEELLVASLSACHMLWYLHLCADAGVVVTAYRDEAEGEMQVESGGAGQFVSVTLRPHVTIAPESPAELAVQLHTRAHEMCFIARSVNFPVRCEPAVIHGAPGPAKSAVANHDE